VTDPYYLVDQRADAGVAVVRLTGDLDINARDDIRAAIARAVNTNQGIRVDLSDVSFMDSEALSSLIEGYNAAVSAGLPFAVVGAQGLVRQVLTVSGALELFDR
jgi:anti-anti-sigma factor